MERQNLILTAVVILVILLAFIVAMTLSGNNSFQTGQLYFEYPNAWSQDYLLEISVRELSIPKSYSNPISPVPTDRINLLSLY